MENVHKILKLDLKSLRVGKKGRKFINSLKVYKGVARLIFTIKRICEEQNNQLIEREEEEEKVF